MKVSIKADDEDGCKTSSMLVAGGKVYMACRSMERAVAAANDIKRQTGVDHNQLVVMQLDLSSLSSVRSFVNSFKTSNSSVFFMFEYTVI